MLPAAFDGALEVHRKLPCVRFRLNVRQHDLLHRAEFFIVNLLGVIISCAVDEEQVIVIVIAGDGIDPNHNRFVLDDEIFDPLELEINRFARR